MFERENFKFKDSIMIHVIDDSKNEKRDFIKMGVLKQLVVGGISLALIFEPSAADAFRLRPLRGSDPVWS